ncbi:hypothetical protein OPQ81_005624 [Rhizoctonia solani]|nr:hypothetical protein OPQ81_005624 [Rhizoctonia solani]
MDQFNPSLSSRRTRKTRFSSNNSTSVIMFDTVSSPNSPASSTVQSMGTMPEHESRRSRICSMLNLRLTRLYVLSWSVSWIPREASRLQICGRFTLILYVLYSLVVFNPFTLYRWLFSGGMLDLWYPTSPLAWTSSPRTYGEEVYGVMTTSFVFSKLSPHLGKLAPNAIRVVYDSHKYNGRTGQTGSNVTSCVWIPDTHIGVLEGWTRLEPHPLSALVTTSHPPESSAFRELTRDITRIVRRNLGLQGTVLLISTQAWLSNTNAYINIARLFAGTSWVLLVPPIRDPPSPSSSIDWSISRLDYRVQVLDSTLLFQRSNKQDLVIESILIPRNSPLWCSERYYISGAGSEWSDCIQDILSYYRELDASQPIEGTQRVDEQKIQ